MNHAESNNTDVPHCYACACTQNKLNYTERNYVIRTKHEPADTP